MSFKPISCLANPVAARWGLGHYEEDEDDRREQAQADRRRERYFESVAERGLSGPLFETRDDVDGFLDELAEGVRGA